MELGEVFAAGGTEYPVSVWWVSEEKGCWPGPASSYSHSSCEVDKQTHGFEGVVDLIPRSCIKFLSSSASE